MELTTFETEVQIPAKQNSIPSAGEFQPPKVNRKSSFIESNCESVTLEHLKNDCITPVFSKCNSVTISHFDFINSTFEVVKDFYKGEVILEPDIRVSHKILGRIHEALHKPKADLLPHEETLFWERCAFFIEIPNITTTIEGNKLSLVVGGVRAFNNQNLYTKKTVEKFKIFSGFVNHVCTNTQVSTDGLLLDVKVMNIDELRKYIYELLAKYDINNHVQQMKDFANYHLTQNQFCQLIGKSRLYQYLPKEQKAQIPELLFNDSQINSIAKAYLEDENFKSELNGDINLWKLNNLYTGANKSSYIDTFLEKSENAFQFTNGIKNLLSGDSSYSWYF